MQLQSASGLHPTTSPGGGGFTFGVELSWAHGTRPKSADPLNFRGHCAKAAMPSANLKPALDLRTPSPLARPSHFLSSELPLHIGNLRGAFGCLGSTFLRACSRHPAWHID